MRVAVMFGVEYPASQQDKINPHAERGGPSAANTSHRRETEMSIDKYPVSRDIEQQAAYRNNHHWLSVFQRGAVVI